MSKFQERYDNLNDQQKLAVKTIDGPVMVVAGPGTGKTELLSVRVANILDKTDTLPGNILCLSFTDNAALNMRQRLIGLIGPDAYKVSIHTFHSLGMEIINQNGEYFYSGANFRPADDLSTYEILNDLLEKLPHSNPLASKMNDKFTNINGIKKAISELKRGGLMPDELNDILDRNSAFIDWFKPQLQAVFDDRVSKATIDKAGGLAAELDSYQEEPLELTNYHSLAKLLQESLDEAVQEARVADSTKPITAWKNTFLEKDSHGHQTLRDEKIGQKLRALSPIYLDYLLVMQQKELYDYDDMILRVTHALEIFDDLRFNLQEKYQYILVDEFQDTNDAQMRLIWNLTNNPVLEGRPNLMVVGDDDQAIYRFQGAEISNILDFVNRYKAVEIVTLQDNYRSSAEILELARAVIVQGEERLENSLDNISKVLTPHHQPKKSIVVASSYQNPSQQRLALAKMIRQDVDSQPSQTKAVIARKHHQLQELLPYLVEQGLTVRYERQEDVLSSEPVVLLEQTARVVNFLAQNQLDQANALLPQILAHPAWSIATRDIWEISLEAHKQKKLWLEIMSTKSEQLQTVADWFIEAARHSQTQPLEFMLDFLFGIGDSDQPSSPYQQYFFGKDQELSSEYLAHLSALQKIRSSLRDYRPGVVLKLSDFIDFINLHQQLGVGLTQNDTTGRETADIVLLTAHKAKGLEFDSVYITDASENIWGSKAAGGGHSLRFPSNLPLSPAGDSDDERLRLLFVSLTRARDKLSLVMARENENGKELLPTGAFANSLQFSNEAELPVAEAITAARTDWQATLVNLPETDKQTLLAPYLENYQLSSTHLNNYLNLPKGGPEYFLLNNLLKMPEAMSPSAAYGSAMHIALQRAHQYLAAKHQKQPVQEILDDFANILQQSQLTSLDFEKYLERGQKALAVFLGQRYDSFTERQQVERAFYGEDLVVNDAKITGKLDLMDIDETNKTIFVTDYKTGKASHNWKGREPYDKLKLHHYEQQLMMYKLLIENSRQFIGYTVTGARLEFVEPDERDEIVLLDYTYDLEKLEEFKQLVGAVWRRIQALEFDLPEGFTPDLKGILQFEASLLT